MDLLPLLQLEPEAMLQLKVSLQVIVWREKLALVSMSSSMQRLSVGHVAPQRKTLFVVDGGLAVEAGEAGPRQAVHLRPAVFSRRASGSGRHANGLARCLIRGLRQKAETEASGSPRSRGQPLVVLHPGASEPPEAAARLNRPCT